MPGADKTEFGALPDAFGGFDAAADAAAEPSWAPLKSGGANFKTAQLRERTGGRIVVERSTGMWAFGLVFALPGLAAVLIWLPMALWRGELGLALFALLWGAGFSAAGVFMLNDRKLVFDRARGEYRFGKRPFFPLPADREIRGPLNEIRALQVLVEHISSDDSDYDSYEINLVLKDGSRLNVMDHGNSDAIEDAAARLARFLKVGVLRK